MSDDPRASKIAPPPGAAEMARWMDQWGREQTPIIRAITTRVGVCYEDVTDVLGDLRARHSALVAAALSVVEWGSDAPEGVTRIAALRAALREEDCPKCGHALAAHSYVTNDGCLLEACMCEVEGLP